MRRTLSLWCLPALLAPRAVAQQVPFSGYYQNVGALAGQVGGGGTAVLDLQRLRLSLAPRWGHGDAEVAYEHTLSWQGTDRAALGLGLLSSTRPGDDWLGVDWTIHDGARVVWRHRFDRLNISHTQGPWSVRAGRQAISWATTLFLSPADPFVPLDPSDPFREYRRGVDALRAQWYPSPLAVVEFVARPASTPAGRTATVLARGKATVAGWEVSAWGGLVHDAAGAGGGFTHSIGASALRAELALRTGLSGDVVVRGAVGMDRRVSLGGHDLYIVAEYQHDGFGAGAAGQLGAVALSPPAGRGELQVLGRDETAIQLTQQVHPLLSLDLLLLTNLRDGSGLLAPAGALSVTNEVTARAGCYFRTPRVGRGATAASEYGALPAGAYLAVSAFF